MSEQNKRILEAPPGEVLKERYGRGAQAIGARQAQSTAPRQQLKMTGAVRRSDAACVRRRSRHRKIRRLVEDRRRTRTRSKCSSTANVKSVAFATTEGGSIETDKLMPPQRKFRDQQHRARRSALCWPAPSLGENAHHTASTTPAAADCDVEEAHAAFRFAQQGRLAVTSPTLAVFASQQACPCFPSQHPSRFAAATTNAGGVTRFRRAHASFCWLV